MAEQWFMRVDGREYGPVDLDTLLEWKAEGRLIGTNEVRRANDPVWAQAENFNALFPAFTPEPVVSENPETQPHSQRRSLGQILADTVRIYARGWLTYVGLAGLIGIPSLGLKISMAFVHIREGIPLTAVGRTAAAIAVVMVAVIVVCWPIFIGGIQFATAEIAAGRKPRLGDIIRRAKNFWPRIAQLCVITYGAFLFWTLLPLFAVLAVAAQPTPLSLLLALLALVVQVFMVGRLFINFLFWQQTATLGGLGAVEALQQSKEVARSRRGAPWLERPLYRGAILASMWVVMTIAVSLAVELPFLIVRMLPAQSIEEAMKLVQALMNAPHPDTLTIVSYVVSTAVDTVLRPLLGIAFVLLYFDAKAER